MSVNIKTENGLVKVAGKVNSFPVNKISSSDYLEDSPIGTVISFMGTTAPSHYLVCDGTVYNIADYSDLADFIQTQFGSKNYFGGDGTTTFAVPDLRGEFLRGTGTNSHENQGSGADVGRHQNATRVPNIYGSHTTTTEKNNYALIARMYQGTVATDYGVGDADSRTRTKNNSVKLTITNSSVTGINTLYDQTAEDVYTVRPTNTSVLYCIKYESTYFMEVEDVGYSTSETFTGKTWIDGKPIYRKVVDFGVLPNASSKTVSANIPNLDKIIKMDAMRYRASDNDASSLPSLTFNITNLNLSVSIFSAEDNITIVTFSDRSNETAMIIIEYTKTTD